MLEISLLDLRDFIASAKEWGRNYSDYSIVGLRLRLQKICAKQRLNEFNKFLFDFKNKEELRTAVFDCIPCHPGELFRDAELWRNFILLEKESLENPSCHILIYDNSNMSDTLTFLICAAFLEVKLRAAISIGGSMRPKRESRDVTFDVKEMDNAQLNFSALSSQIQLISMFEQQEAHFHFRLPEMVAFLQESFSELPEFKCKQEFDLLLSHNNSLKYNYVGQQKYFVSCLQALKDGGRAFFGLRENFSSCHNSTRLVQPDPLLNRFIKNGE